MPAPIIYTHLLLPCPTCQAQQYRQAVEDADPPGQVPDVVFCHECADYDGLREYWLPTRVVLTAFRQGRTDQQAYDELATYVLANSSLPEMSRW